MFDPPGEYVLLQSKGIRELEFMASHSIPGLYGVVYRTVFQGCMG